LTIIKGLVFVLVLLLLEAVIAAGAEAVTGTDRTWLTTR